MGFSHVLPLCLQGGGVRIDGGTVTLSSCNITGNTATYVRVMLKFPIAPMGFSHVLRFVLAGRRCSHRRWHGDLVIVQHHWQHSYLCACSCSNFPSSRWENAFLSCPIRNSPFKWDPFLFYQGYVRARDACKMSITPMGDSRFACCL
jgi:hypothetical protein